MAGSGFRRVRALSARTHFVPGHGQIHFDPDSKKEEVKFPKIPEDQVEILVERGWVKDDVETDIDESDLPALRSHYQSLAGKKAFGGWDADELKARIADLEAKDDQAPA